MVKKKVPVILELNVHPEKRFNEELAESGKALQGMIKNILLDIAKTLPMHPSGKVLDKISVEYVLENNGTEFFKVKGENIISYGDENEVKKRAL
jgi:hypothetical protein